LAHLPRQRPGNSGFGGRGCNPVLGWETGASYAISTLVDVLRRQTLGPAGCGHGLEADIVALTL
jgi:hypothetical protein